jgi:two-component system response regulator
MSQRIIEPRPAEILLVEDNENDVVLTRESFKIVKLTIKLHHVKNGQECMAFLRKEAPYENVPTPDLILLDLNMPIMDGREVLQELVADPALNHLPVVILTTSTEEKDILTMYKLRASSYIVKPVDFDQFMRVIREFGNYWFTVVVLPPKND